jgi:hypothetical protein
MAAETMAAGEVADPRDISAPAGADRLSGTPASWRVHLIVTIVGCAAAAMTLAYVSAYASTTAKLNDFYREAWPAYQALIHGHLVEFLRLGPAYVGSLVLRAPFALIPSAWGGGSRAVYFASALPCLIAMVLFCTWLGAQPRRNGKIGWGSRINPIVLCIFNPVVLIALLGGHPEEILGAVLCAGGVALAANGNVGWAGILIGVAVINKPWALVAVPVALAVMPSHRRQGLLIIAATVGAVMIPVTLVRAHGLSATGAGAQLGVHSGTIFNPPQLLWWFGSHSWIVRQARPAIVLMSVACAALWWLLVARNRPLADRSRDALLLLALVLLLRAALDPWNNLYYHVPFLFALMAYEVRSGRMPLLTVTYTFVLLVVVPIGGLPHMSHDLRAAVYAAIVLPTIACIAAKLYLPADAWRRFAGVFRAALAGRAAAEKATLA